MSTRRRKPYLNPQHAHTWPGTRRCLGLSYMLNDERIRFRNNRSLAGKGRRVKLQVNYFTLNGRWFGVYLDLI